MDVVCWGRFYDFFEKRDGRWAIVRRQPIYEKDRLDPVDPAASSQLDAGAAAGFPEGYRHLAYLQAKSRLQGETSPARAAGTGGGEALRRGRGLAGGSGPTRRAALRPSGRTCW